MSHKVITIEIIAFDGYEAEGINHAVGNILEREDWQVFGWFTEDATPEQIAWFQEEERKAKAASDRMWIPKKGIA